MAGKNDDQLNGLPHMNTVQASILIGRK
jgi:hypothetical protein